MFLQILNLKFLRHTLLKEYYLAGKLSVLEMTPQMWDRLFFYLKKIYFNTIHNTIIYILFTLCLNDHSFKYNSYIYDGFYY